MNDHQNHLTVSIFVTDPELVEEISRYPEGGQRDDYILGALRIGVLTLKRAQGQIDADLVNKETNRLVENLNAALSKFFDPTDGKFNERVERLVRKDGELEQVLRQQIGADNSELSRTLAAYIGEQSPLMQILSTDESEGFLRALSESIQKRLDDQRSKLLNEFSLDDERSVLSRLVKHVKTSQSEITDEFSLDKEGSALNRMRKELLELFEILRKDNADFRSEVGEQLAAIAARKEEAQKSTRHGVEFEEAAVAFLQEEAQRIGDIATPTGNTVGNIKNCKVGDCVIKIGPDEKAAGALIVAEVKEVAGYSLQKALNEIEMGKKNRGAGVGLFIFSKRTVPVNLEPMRRYGNDVVVVWDPEDQTTDIYLSAALSVARAICAQNQAQNETVTLDIESIESAIRDVEKQINGLDEIKQWSETIENNSNKILNRVRIMRNNLTTQVSVLDNSVSELRAVISEG